MTEDLGTPFEGQSVRGRRALEELRLILIRLGYTAYRQRANAISIQTYPADRGTYPLLTQRFEHPDDASLPISTPSLVIQATSDAGSWAMNTRLLAADQQSDDWVYTVANKRQIIGRLRLHGWFVIPLSLQGQEPETTVRFELLPKPLGQIRAYLLPLTKGRKLGW